MARAICCSDGTSDGGEPFVRFGEGGGPPLTTPPDGRSGAPLPAGERSPLLSSGASIASPGRPAVVFDGCCPGSPGLPGRPFGAGGVFIASCPGGVGAACWEGGEAGV